MDPLQAEALFRTLVDDTLDDAVFVHDSRGRISAVNQSACQALGYARDELLGLRMSDIDTTAEPTLLKTWQQASPGRHPVRSGSHRARDGRQLPAETRCALLVQGGLHTFVNVVRYHHGGAPAQDPQKGERLFGAVFHASGLGIGISRLDGAFVEINQAMLDMFGYRHEEVIGRTALELGMWPDLSQRDRLRALVDATGHAHAFEADFQRRDGSTGVLLLDVNRVQLDGVDHMIGMMQDISERKRVATLQRDQAYRDPLTGVANRRLLHERLALAIEFARQHGSPAGLMLIDLDHFKQVNDLHGHVLGDELLVEVAHRLTAAVRRDDTVARFGGDEFVILMPALDAGHGSPLTRLQSQAERVHASLTLPYHLQSQRDEPAGTPSATRRFTASVGITLITGQETEVQAALRNADLAMYRAKRDGRDCVRAFVDSPAPP